MLENQISDIDMLLGLLFAGLVVVPSSLNINPFCVFLVKASSTRVASNLFVYIYM
jgi:hypothetical protein